MIMIEQTCSDIEITLQIYDVQLLPTLVFPDPGNSVL